MPTPPPPLHRTRYGTANPEVVENELWRLAMSKNWTAYTLRKHLAQKWQPTADDRNFHKSQHRDSEPGPYWSWERFGRTSTALPDGRIIHIAGEHEDSYDPDFCIYNDVVVEHPGGERTFYLYPMDVFPPTDFHTATLVGSDILLIGSLGYQDLRRPGVTQVLKLDTTTLAITSVKTSGDGPGWISKHQVERLADDKILLVGGTVQMMDDYIDNPDLFELDLTTMCWRRRHHGDTAIFPVTKEDYLRGKAPAYGVTNPERVTNPVWLAMAKVGWAPSRVRLHFGDRVDPEPRERTDDDGVDLGNPPARGTPEHKAWFAALDRSIARQKNRRPRHDVVWTACRRDPINIGLTDGRRLMIGGEVLYYGDEAVDAWNYTDIVATDSQGAIAISAYPLDVFPHLAQAVAHEHEGHVIIIGMADRHRQPDLADQVIVLRLDLSTFAITRVAAAQPGGFRLAVYQGCDLRDGDRVVFHNRQLTAEDPALLVEFDLATLTWGEPYAPAPTAGEHKA